MREIEEAFGSDNVELLEDYPEDPGPTALILGFTDDCSPLHAGVGMSDPAIPVLVTIYRPRAELWYDWRRSVREI